MGIRKPAVFLKNDSIYNFESSGELHLVHSAGKIENKNLLVFNDSRYDFKYYLADLANSPNIELKNKINIVDIDNYQIYSAPEQIYHMEDSLYLYKETLSKILMLALFSDDKIKLIKRLKPEGTIITFPGLIDWRFFNNKIFYIEKKKLVCERYDHDSTDFIGKEIVIDNIGDHYSFSGDNNFFARIINDSLFVYSLKQMKLINSYSLSSFKYKSNIFIDSPDVYLHQIKIVTDVEENNELPEKFSLSQNYPNPFNPSTVISYRLPSAGYVTLKVYDVLGREIVTLVDEYKQAGNYNSQLSTDNFRLSSGIYFYTLKSGGYSEVKKMLLLK
jgi:hypothetical protein